MRGRHKQNTNSNYNGTVKRLLRWCEEKGVDAEPVHRRPSRDSSDRVKHSMDVERLLGRWVVYLVEVQDSVQPKSVGQYVTSIRSTINGSVGYDIQLYHRHSALTKTIDGLSAQHPHRPSRRDPLMQQHLLQWSKRLDCTLHSHRVGLAIAVTTWGNSCRFGDLAPRLLSGFDPRCHALFEDVDLSDPGMGYLTIKDHKTARRSSWAPKSLPPPEVTYPITVAGVEYGNVSELITCTSSELPPPVVLCPYFQLARLMKLSGKTDPKTPLFHIFGGKPVYYDTYLGFVRKISGACGHEFITPHSGRAGGETATEATGVASVHTLRTCGYWSAERSTHKYGEATTENQAKVLRAIAQSNHTDLAIYHAPPGAHLRRVPTAAASASARAPRRDRPGRPSASIPRTMDAPLNETMAPPAPSPCPPSPEVRMNPARARHQPARFRNPK